MRQGFKDTPQTLRGVFSSAHASPPLGPALRLGSVGSGALTSLVQEHCDLYRALKARWVRRTLAGFAVHRPMIHRGPNDREAQGHIHAFGETVHLGRDVPLVMVHCHHGVKGLLIGHPVKTVSGGTG